MTRLLAVNVHVLHSSSCSSEGEREAGSCHPGLKVYGSTDRTVLMDSPAEALGSKLKAWSRQMDGSYGLMASACYLRTAPNQTFHLGVWGLDGVSNLTISASPIASISEFICPGDGEGAAASVRRYTASAGYVAGSRGGIWLPMEEMQDATASPRARGFLFVLEARPIGAERSRLVAPADLAFG